jgi:hypothetical protein
MDKVQNKENRNWKMILRLDSTFRELRKYDYGFLVYAYLH